MTNIINLALAIYTNIRYFFWWSAGAVRTVVEKCPTEQGKFTAVGILVVFISIMGSISFAFFLSLTFDVHFQTALPFGLLWGAMIFCLDRVLLTSYRKEETSKISVIQRFILTIAIAILIGEPMLLYFFRNEINLELVRRGQIVSKETRQAAEESFKSEVESINIENTQTQNRLDSLKKERDDKEQAVIGETEGTVGSGVEGFGPTSKLKEIAFKEADAKFTEYQKESAAIFKKNQNRLEVIKTQIEKEVKNIEDNYSQAKGVLIQHEALFALVKRDAGAALVYIPLFIILLLLETLPLSLKVLSKKSVYDELLASREAQQKSEINKQAVYAAKQTDYFHETLEKIERIIHDAVLGRNINGLNDSDLIRLAESLKADLLEMIEAKRLKKKITSFNEAEFGDEILIEVVDNLGFEFICQMPIQNRGNFSIKTLAADINRIGIKIGESLGEKVRFAKAFTSRMKEISTSLPLLAQLENDRKLILEFEPTGEPI